MRYCPYRVGNRLLLLVCESCSVATRSANSKLDKVVDRNLFYSFAYLFLPELATVIEIPTLTRQILAVSNIVGSLLILGLPMGHNSKFLVAERERSERLLHNIIPKEIADRLKVDKTSITLENPEITVLMADIVNLTAFSDKVSAKLEEHSLDWQLDRFLACVIIALLIGNEKVGEQHARALRGFLKKRCQLRAADAAQLCYTNGGSVP